MNPINSVFSDGLFEERLPPASVGDREASLYTKISPPVLTSESKENAFFELKLFDAKTDNNIEHVSYFITVQKDGELILRDLFHSHQGPLKIKIDPQPGEFVNIFGSTEPFLGGWTSQTGDISVSGPILLEGGLYHFAIEIFGIDNDRNIFTPETAPRFDSYLSVGDIFKNDIIESANKYNLTIISYYDQVQNFTYDSPKKEISWVMPFNWDLNRIQEQNIFVHEEVKIPKSFTGFGDSNSFNATVNLSPVTGRSLAIDPFTEENNLILHYLLNKADLIRLAEDPQNQGVETMNFSLSPSEDKPVETTTEIVSDQGGILTKLNWPDTIMANQDTELNLMFSDALTDSEINGDIKYDITFYDQNDNQVLKKENLLAKNATDSQIIKFPATGIYQIELEVKSINYPGIVSPDETRNGISRGNVIIS
ncbi:MAG: peptidase [Nitrososphaeraceae archaeon]